MWPSGERIRSQSERPKVSGAEGKGGYLPPTPKPARDWGEPASPSGGRGGHGTMAWSWRAGSLESDLSPSQRPLVRLSEPPSPATMQTCEDSEAIP